MYFAECEESYFMRSDIVKKGATRCAHRSLFHADGYGEEDLKKPLVGICN